MYQDFVNQFGESSNAYILTAGWARDTRDDILYPTQGRLQSVLLETGLPFGDLSYYKLQYMHSVVLAGVRRPRADGARGLG